MRCLPFFLLETCCVLESLLGACVVPRLAPKCIRCGAFSEALRPKVLGIGVFSLF